MLCWLDERREIALLNRGRLVLLDAATGTERAAVTLDHDNYGIVAPWKTRQGTRLVVKNTEASYRGYWYANPAHLFDESLQHLHTWPSVVGSGHSVRTFDLDGDGADELLLGYEAFGADGRQRWRLEGLTEAGYDQFAHHEDQLQIGRLAKGEPLSIVWAGSTNLSAGTLDYCGPTGTDPVGPDGYGVRIADVDKDGRAEILVHDRTTAWIYKPPDPAAGARHTHAKLRPVTGQGWYAV